MYRPPHNGGSRWAARTVLAATCAALLAGCGSVSTGNAGTGTLGTTTTSKADVMTFRPTSLPVAYLGESYRALVGVTGGVGPYGYRLSAGTLPPGLKFSGAAISGATLSGTPTKSGSYTFSIEATDANLSTRVQEFTLNVDALPPLSLQPTLPPSDIRGETRIPLTIKAPRNVRATRLSWDLGKDVEVTRVQPGDPSSLLFWRQSGTVLTLDIGFRTVPRADARIALITVKPKKAVRLKTDSLGYEARDGAGTLLAEKKRPGTEEPPADKKDDTKESAQQEITPAQPGTATDAKSDKTPAATSPIGPTQPADVTTSPLPSPALPTPEVPPSTPPATGGNSK